MPSQQVIDAGRYERFKSLELTAQAARADMVKRAAEYWASLHEIWRDALWEDAGYSKQDDWVKEFCHSPSGVSETAFRQVMRVLEAMTQNGAQLSTAYFAVATELTAIRYDMTGWFERKGKNRYVIRPEVAERIAEHGGLDAAVQAIASLPPAEARREVQRTNAPNARVIFCAEFSQSFGAYLVKLVESGGDEPTRTFDLVIGVSPERTLELENYLRRKFNPMGE